MNGPIPEQAFPPGQGTDPARPQIVFWFGRYLRARNALNRHPLAVAAFRDARQVGYEEYCKAQAECTRVSGALWLATDISYAEDGFREHVWRWRYRHVQMQRCVWILKKGSPTATNRAARIMQNFVDAEYQLACVCGLRHDYLCGSFTDFKPKSTNTPMSEQPTAQPSNVETRIKETIQDLLGCNIDLIKPESTLESLGGDSLDAVEMVMAVEEEYDIEIPDVDAEKFKTVSDIVNYITEKVKPDGN